MPISSVLGYGNWCPDSQKRTWKEESTVRPISGHLGKYFMFIPFDIEFLLEFSHRKSHWEALVLFPVFPISWAADGVLAAASWKKIVCFFKMLICSKEKQVMDKLSASCPMIAWHCVSTWSRFTVKLWSWGQDQSADPTCRKLFTQMISLLTSYLMYKLICTCLHYGIHLPLFNLFAGQTHNDQSSVTAAPSLVLSSREWRAASFIKECTGTILKIVSK